MLKFDKLVKYLSNDRKLLVAYSGGLDSTVLLHQLMLLKQTKNIQLRAIHIHHGLSPNADQWAQHCHKICNHWNISLEIVKIKISKQGNSIEAAAREGRYQAFLRHLQFGEILVTAQHLDDQCETLFLAIKRGSGPAGLASMPISLSLGTNLLLRPFLHFRRKELEKWAKNNQLCWIEDEINQDIRYDRNFLRQEIFPKLNSRWPNFSKTAARSAELCGEQEQLLDELLQESLVSIMQSDGALCIEKFSELSEVKRSALLRRWIAVCGGKMPSRDAIKRIWSEVICARKDASPVLQFGKFEVRRYRKMIYWIKRKESVRNVVVPWINLQKPLLLPQELGTLQLEKTGMEIRPPRIDEQVTVRFLAKGRFSIIGQTGYKKIKKLWQEYGIPPWKRNSTPLIFYNDILIAALDVFICCDGYPTKGNSIHIMWRSCSLKIL